MNRARALQALVCGRHGAADRNNHRDGNDDDRQPRALFELFDAGQKQRLFSNYAAAKPERSREAGARPGRFVDSRADSPRRPSRRVIAKSHRAVI